MGRDRTRQYAASSDEDLLELVSKGDEQALAATYDRHSTPVYSLAMRILGDSAAAEDLVQEIFLHAWRRPAEYRPARGSVRTWLLTITRNRAIDQLRSRDASARRQTALENVEATRSHGSAGEEAEEGVLGQEARGHLRGLPEAQGQVLALAYYGGYTQNEISEMLELPLGTVKSRMRLGLEALRQRMGAGRGDS